MRKTKYWLWLSMVFGIGNNRLWKVMRLFDEPVLAFEELCSGEYDKYLTQKEIEKIRNVTLESCIKTITYCHEKGYGVCSYSDDEYPYYLRHIYNPPALLYYQGNIDIINKNPSVTVVGTRKATVQSQLTTRRLCSDIANSGFLITSGFAVGIDITSHLSAINQKKPTVCVLGCGLDVNYPKENFQYRDEVLKNGGLFLTEYMLGTSPHPQNFPKRNRILSGISRATIIIEAPEKSGSLITAELAMEQGREVFCVPPADIYNPIYAGNIKFLREGAFSVYSAEDITSCYCAFNDELTMFNIANQSDNLNDVDEERDIKLQEQDLNKVREVVTDETEKEEQEVEEIETLEETPTKELNLDDYPPLQRKIVEILMNGKEHADIISEKIDENSSEIITELIEMELDGIIKSYAGQIYGLC